LSARISTTSGKFSTKIHAEASDINASNWGKVGGFNITFRWFSTLAFCTKNPKFWFELQTSAQRFVKPWEGVGKQNSQIFYVFWPKCPDINDIGRKGAPGSW